MPDALDNKKLLKLGRKSILIIALTIVVLILIVSNVFTVYYLFQKNNQKSSNVVLEQTGSVDIEKDKNDEAQSGNGNTNENIDDSIASSAPKSDTLLDEKNPELQEGDVFVEWRDIKTKLSRWEAFDYMALQKAVNKFNVDNTYDNINADSLLDKYDVYKVGFIKEGVYEGKDLLIFTFRPEGPASRDSLLRVVKDGSELIVLTEYSDSIYGIEKELFTENDKIHIVNLDYEKEIMIPNSDILLRSDNALPLELLLSISDPVKVFEYKSAPVYKNGNGCYFVELEDGTVKYYNLDLKFTASREDVVGYAGRSPNLLDITWSDGLKNVDEYVSSKIGCNFGICYAYADYIKDFEQLEKVGETSMGDDIYELKDDIMVDYGGEERGVLRNVYDMYSRTRNAISFEEFLKAHPLIFWKDPFGAYIEFRNDNYQPAAECGKPVIYLYPEKETDILVYVEPTGGFSFTEPVYDNGWKVKASPDGAIYNYADKTEYPYLFWEGRGNDYIRPEKGFVVQKNDVKSFLEEKLSALGLIKKEYDEFIEFWLPKMQEKDYYFITFVPKEEFDKIAPLSVFPEPDNVIRVFMDFEGLDSYIKVDEPFLETPERRGFTVVEWGGALH